MSSFWQQVIQSLSPLIRGSKHSVDGMAEGLRRQGALQKLAARIRVLNRERSQLVRTVGKKVYSLHTRGQVRNQDVLGDCLRIDEAGQQIEAIQQQMEELRRKAVAGEDLVVDIEDEAPLTEDVEEDADAADWAEEQPPEPAREELAAEVENEVAVAEEEEGAAEAEL